MSRPAPPLPSPHFDKLSDQEGGRKASFIFILKFNFIQFTFFKFFALPGLSILRSPAAVSASLKREDFSTPIYPDTLARKPPPMDTFELEGP